MIKIIKTQTYEKYLDLEKNFDRKVKRIEDRFYEEKCKIHQSCQERMDSIYREGLDGESVSGRRYELLQLQYEEMNQRAIKLQLQNSEVLISNEHLLSIIKKLHDQNKAQEESAKPAK